MHICIAGCVMYSDGFSVMNMYGLVVVIVPTPRPKMVEGSNNRFYAHRPIITIMVVCIFYIFVLLAVCCILRGLV